MIYLVNCNKRKRIIIRILLILLGLGCIISALFLSWIIVILGLYLLAMVGFINDQQLVIYSDRFEIKHISIINRLSSLETFYYMDLKSIKFDKGFTDIIGAIIEIKGLGNTIYSKPDTIEVIKNDGSRRSINRIGLKSDFYKGCEVMIEQMNKYRSNK
jgi:hypothetical protein